MDATRAWLDYVRFCPVAPPLPGKADPTGFSRTNPDNKVRVPKSDKQRCINVRLCPVMSGYFRYCHVATGTQEKQT